MIEEIYKAAPSRYEAGGMLYRRAGRSGVLLPAVSLGLWQNFGDTVPFDRCRRIMHYAFDHGITHFDLANNYGPPYGSAEETFGRMMKGSFAPYRDELFISTKAGYDMWPGPYGNWGSRKYLMASLDQSLKRMKLEYVDLFYIHRYDPETPLDETLQALVDIVKQGKALYVGISRWPADALRYGFEFLDRHDCHCLLFQDRLNMLDRQAIDAGGTGVASDSGVGFVAFSPLAQGLLTSRYLGGTVPDGSRASRNAFLKSDRITPELVERLNALNGIASRRGQTLAQMALSWILSHREVTSVLVGASSEEQLASNLDAIRNLSFTDEEFAHIDRLGVE
ncbi:MAG: L-glyceraldehyde 3-phosphate reductase [Bacteroidales bacterium]|nr:L-glyceraldehyde 3-phosphate reductase [Bacteroidales bacterium]